MSHLSTVYGSSKASARKIFEAFNKNKTYKLSYSFDGRVVRILKYSSGNSQLLLSGLSVCPDQELSSVDTL